MVGSAPSCGWTLAAESLVIVREDSGVPRTLKSLVFFDCASPPLGTTAATLWFGLVSRFARGPADLRDAATIHHSDAAGERHGRALKELTTGL